jgi:hypothetical protein
LRQSVRFASAICSPFSMSTDGDPIPESARSTDAEAPLTRITVRGAHLRWGKVADPLGRRFGHPDSGSRARVRKIGIAATAAWEPAAAGSTHAWLSGGARRGAGGWRSRPWRGRSAGSWLAPGPGASTFDVPETLVTEPLHVGRADRPPVSGSHTNRGWVGRTLLTCSNTVIVGGHRRRTRRRGSPNAGTSGHVPPAARRIKSLSKSTSATCRSARAALPPNWC